VADREAVNAAFAQVKDVDILICNAGICYSGLMSQLPEADWDRIFAVNVKGIYNCVNAAMPSFLQKQAGCIITVSSMWGQSGASCEAAYSATKGAVIALTQALAKELGPSGIRVNCVAPGVIQTDMCATVSPETMEALRQVRCAKAAGLPVHALPAHPQADFVQLICEELDSPGISILSSEGLSSKAEADTAGEALLRALCPSRRIRTLCVFGGDTFAAAMNALDISTLHICRELYPGVVLSAARTDQGRLFVISKAGSFGSPDLIVRLHGALRT
jgi:NAD(P)-dependent dehydrogenase (short-subunit alcohol dehydrogenase family)